MFDINICLLKQMIKTEEIIPQKPGVKPNIAKLESAGYLLKVLGECHKWYYKRV